MPRSTREPHLLVVLAIWFGTFTPRFPAPKLAPATGKAIGFIVRFSRINDGTVYI